MSQSASPAGQAQFIYSENINQSNRTIIDRAAAYGTVILLYEDDFSDTVCACWAEPDRLSVKTSKLGSLPNGLEVHAFGLGSIQPGTAIEIRVVDRSPESTQDTVRTLYRSLLNEFLTLQVGIRISES